MTLTYLGGACWQGQGLVVISNAMLLRWTGKRDIVAKSGQSRSGGAQVIGWVALVRLAGKEQAAALEADDG